MSPAPIEDLANDYGLNSARFALAALSFLEPVGRDTLKDLASMRDQLAVVELCVVALLREDGVSWQSMAADLGVAKQSLHYRLSSRVYKWIGQSDSRRRIAEDWEALQDGLRRRVQVILKTPHDAVAGVVRPTAGADN